MRPRVKGGLLLLLAFVLGVAAGASGYAVYRARVGWWGAPQGAARLQEFVLRRLTRELDLRPEQRQQVEAILREAGDQFARLRGEMRPRFHEIRDRTRERIQTLLDPDQKIRFEALMDLWDRERGHRGSPVAKQATTPSKSP
jgi:Spy/CpxP family protein refolding chaperone